MSLLLPLALLGLLVLPLIVLLHLLRHRRQPVKVASLRLWHGLQQKRQGTLPRYLPLSLLLILQLLAAAALALALARPVQSFFLAPPRHTIFLLDTTTSMAAEDAPNPGGAGVVRRFDAARQAIQQHLQSMGAADTLAVIALNPAPAVLLAGSAGQKNQMTLALDEVIPGAAGLDLAAAFTLANGLARDTARQTGIVILTDGAFPSAAEPLPPLLAPATWQLIPGPAVQSDNVALLNVSAQTLPDGRQRLFARVVNYSAGPVARTLRVLAGEQVVSETEIQLDPQAETSRVFTLSAAAQTARVEIVEPDALPLDNRADLWLAGQTQTRVLLVSDLPDVPARALAVQPNVQLTVASPALEGVAPADFDVTVFDGLPPQLTAWPAGSVLVVNPPPEHPLLPGGSRFTRPIRPNPDTASPLLAGLDLSGVYFREVTRLPLPDWAEPDLTAQSADQAETLTPLIFHGQPGGSRVVVWAFNLRQSNLPERLALPLLTANTLARLAPPAPPPVIAAGEPVLLDRDFTVELPGGRRVAPLSAAPDAPALFSPTRQPGLYRIYNPANVAVAGFAVHAGSALEANLRRTLSPAELEPVVLPRPAAALTRVFDELWPWLVGLALAVVMVE